MQKTLQSSAVKAALTQLGWSQKDLAEKVGVTAQSVTNWMKGNDFPRPDKLLRLAMLLKLNFSELVEAQSNAPVVAFRKRGGTKTTEAHRLKAMAMGAMLQPLVQFLPELNALRTTIPSPSMEYQALQNAVKRVREKLGIGMQASLRYQHVISEFQANDAFIVPVLWGQKTRHENALHILLPKEQVTFIYLNLDTHIEDFKFWMAHELAHVYTPELAGTDAGEDFADAFAGAFLFPGDIAKIAYADSLKRHTGQGEMTVLSRYADEYEISIYTVYREIQNYANAMGLPALQTLESGLHAVRNSKRGELVSDILFKPVPAAPSAIIASAQSVFQSHFFEAMQRMLHAKGTGAGYLQQVLDVSLQDAVALHAELVS